MGPAAGAGRKGMERGGRHSTLGRPWAYRACPAAEDFCGREGLWFDLWEEAGYRWLLPAGMYKESEAEVQLGAWGDLGVALAKRDQRKLWMLTASA